jgi:predicted glycoside hydrolase/deacetylase ChbG (UPF0249 family)
MLLRVVADDFGYCQCRSDGIGKCSSPAGLVNTLSVLVTHNTTITPPEGVELGLHLNLTEGRPVSADVPSLVDAATGLMRGKFGVREKRPSDADVRREAVAQVGELSSAASSFFFFFLAF